MWTPWNYIQPRLDDRFLDYKKILCDNSVEIEFEGDPLVIWGKLSEYKKPHAILKWKNRSVCIGRVSYEDACMAAALYIELYQRGLSHNLCRKLIHCYLTS